jgi:hypothetical protein
MKRPTGKGRLLFFSPLITGLGKSEDEDEEGKRERRERRGDRSGGRLPRSGADKNGRNG